MLFKFHLKSFTTYFTNKLEQYFSEYMPLPDWIDSQFVRVPTKFFGRMIFILPTYE